MILGDLSILTDGTPVMVAPASSGPKVASETPTQGKALAQSSWHNPVSRG